MTERRLLLDSISESGKNVNAGTKARKDINAILADYEHEYLYTGNNALAHLIHYYVESWRMKNRKEICVVQYPYYIKDFLADKVKDWAPRNSILLIHDIMALQNSLGEDAIRHEMRNINGFRCVISHNAKMTAWLKANGCTAKIVDLEFFDYLRNPLTKNPDDVKREYTVAFAGNLSREKSGFIYHDHTFQLHLYGANYDAKTEYVNTKYCGVVPADVLPDVLCEDFGLVWDGQDEDCCSGKFGDYLRYNNPHKASLYISSCLPVIVWKKAAIADFIVENALGIAVDSLSEIDEALRNTSDEVYKKMRRNVRELSEKMNSGYFTRRAVENAVNELKKMQG